MFSFKTVVVRYISVEAKPLQPLNYETAKGMWLHSVYVMKSYEGLGLTQKQFFEFKWDLSINLGTHYSKLKHLASKMKKLVEAIPNSMLMSRIMSMLP